MEFVLLIGLLVLACLYFQMSTRIAALELLLSDLGHGRPEESIPDTLEAERPPARVVRAASAAVPERALIEPEPEPQPEPEAASAPPETLASLFERLVGGRLLIWIGGIALAVAGVFLIRYSIEIGLITPPVRMIMAALFGLLLLAAGEYARSRPGATPDPRVAQALVGAGILILYATPYGSLILYGLISKTTASALMVLVTALALFLSLRHGAPTAVLGLLGGFATPLLVGERSDSAVPLLAYLGLLNLALFALSTRRGWSWLAAAAVVLSFAWSGLYLFGRSDDAVATGIFVVGLSIAASLLRTGEGWQMPFLRPAAIGLLQLALLVTRGDIDVTAWGLYGALALACFFLAQRRPEYRPLPALALGVALFLLAEESIDPNPILPWVAAAIILIFVGGSLPGALRGERGLAPVRLACAALAGPLLILRVLRPELLGAAGWGGLAALLALGPLLLAWRQREARPILAASATVMLLLAVAAGDLVPGTLLASAWLVLALGAGLAARRRDHSGLAGLAGAAAGIAILWCVLMAPQLWSTLSGSIAGMPAYASDLPSVTTALEGLLLPAGLLGALWRLLPAYHPSLRTGLLAASGLFLAAAAYIMFKQVFDLRTAADFVARGFAERLVITQVLFVAGWLICTGRLRVPWLDARERWRVGTLLTALAAARLLWFDIMLHNPALTDQWVGGWPVANLLPPAYLLGAFWLYRARQGAGQELRSGVWLALSLVSLVVGVMLMVRQLFQGAILANASISSAESYGYSLAGLLLSIALLGAGIRLPDKALRLAGLILLTATILKVFLSDASALEGLLRILSFLGLGIALIGIGKLYTAVLTAEARPGGGRARSGG
jgi:uncharacterized membrane protein